MLARATLVLFGVLAAARGASAPACWAPGDLTHKAGEERVQKGVKQAHIAPPKRALVQYSPVAQHGAVRSVKLPAGKKLIAFSARAQEPRYRVVHVVPR
jgi:hypothetical protein